MYRFDDFIVIVLLWKLSHPCFILLPQETIAMHFRAVSFQEVQKIQLVRSSSVGKD